MTIFGTKFMASRIFPQKVSGDYLNDKFISISVQLDTTKADNDIIKAWYADTHDIAVKYNVRAYPTYLIFTPDGHAVHRIVGSRPGADDYSKDLASSFDSTHQNTMHCSVNTRMAATTPTSSIRSPGPAYMPMTWRMGGRLLLTTCLHSRTY